MRRLHDFRMLSPVTDMDTQDAPLIRRMIHDLTQPLTALQGQLELALHFSRDAGEMRQNVAEAMEESERLADLMRNVRLWADALLPFAQPVPFALQPWIAAAVDQIRPLGNELERRIFLEMDGPGFPLHGDPARLQAALHQMIDFMLACSQPHDSLTIFVHTGSEQAEILITGGGPVLSRGECEMLFEQPKDHGAVRAVRAADRFRLMAAARTIHHAGGRCSARPSAKTGQVVIEIAFAGERPLRMAGIAAESAHPIP